MINARTLNSCLLAGTLLLTHSAYGAEAEKPYIGLDYSQHTYTNTNPGASDASPTAIRLRAGSVISEYFAVEAHAAIGAGDDTTTVTSSGGSVDYEISIPLVYGLFLRPQVKLGGVTLYALGGYSSATWEYSPAPTSGDTTKRINGGSYGAGLQVDLGSNWGLNADYVSYVQDISTISAGVVYRF